MRRLPVDPLLVVPTLALVAIGLINLAHLGTASPRLYAHLAERQALWGVVGLVLAALTYSLARAAKHRAVGTLHVVVVVAVLATLLGASTSQRGAHRWLSLGRLLVQPSEFLKLTMVAAIARWIGDALPGTISPLSAAAWVTAIIVIPSSMVWAQPDLGTASVLLIVSASVLVFAPRTRMTLGALGVVVAVPTLVMRTHLLRPYQIARIEAFLAPSHHTDVAWQSMQARVAMADGRWFGGDAMWTSSCALPDAHTDFALAAWGQYRGLLGVALVLALQAMVTWRAFDTARRVSDRYDLALTAGVGALLFWQCALNAAMVFGLVPVVGIVLPFLSYGGSNLCTSLAALGLVAGVRARIDAQGPAATTPGLERLYRGSAESAVDPSLAHKDRSGRCEVALGP